MTKIIFQKSKFNPVITRKYNTFHSIHVANPDILEIEDKYFFYFRGQGIEGHDQIGVATCNKKEFDGGKWEFYKDNPIIRVESEKDTFDNQHILDPATIMNNNKIFLYYAGHSKNKECGIGLAISEDGYNFKKNINPVIKGAMSPEVVFYNNQYHLFYSKLSKKGNLDIYKSVSDNGIDFHSELKVFTPSNSKNEFDSFSISTVRIFKHGQYFYMIYGGCDKYFDYPKAFGLARSKDLLIWDRYPFNPVMERGLPGQWDEGALWFGTVIENNNKFYLFYEGVGAGLGINTPEGKECSDICRNEDYGGYRKFSFSQIGLAIYENGLEW